MSRRSVAAWCGQVLGWSVLLLGLALVAVGVVVPRVVGGTPYAVLTGSMSPTLPPGTLVVTRPVDVDDVRIGDVVTYQLSSGEATVVTHRVVGSRLDENGERLLLTKGDTNQTVDVAPVRSVQVRGRVWYAVPQLGRVNAVLTNDQRQLAIYGLGSLLGLYAGGMFVGALRDRRDRGDRMPGRRVAVDVPRHA